MIVRHYVNIHLLKRGTVFPEIIRQNTSGIFALPGVTMTTTFRNNVYLLYSNGLIELLRYDTPCELDCSGKGACYMVHKVQTCVCALGYTGANCETIIDVCANANCSVIGTERCENHAADFLCKCRTGWKGKLCNNPDVCSIKPCGLNAACYEHKGKYICLCRKYGNVRFTGRHCETILPK